MGIEYQGTKVSGDFSVSTYVEPEGPFKYVIVNVTTIAVKEEQADQPVIVEDK